MFTTDKILFFSNKGHYVVGLRAFRRRKGRVLCEKKKKKERNMKERKRNNLNTSSQFCLLAFQRSLHRPHDLYNFNDKQNCMEASLLSALYCTRLEWAEPAYAGIYVYHVVHT